MSWTAGLGTLWVNAAAEAGFKPASHSCSSYAGHLHLRPSVGLGGGMGRLGGGIGMLAGGMGRLGGGI